jgi:hypothetical protein
MRRAAVVPYAAGDLDQCLRQRLLRIEVAVRPAEIRCQRSVNQGLSAEQFLAVWITTLWTPLPPPTDYRHRFGSQNQLLFQRLHVTRALPATASVNSGSTVGNRVRREDRAVVQSTGDMRRALRCAQVQRFEESGVAAIS